MILHRYIFLCRENSGQQNFVAEALLAENNVYYHITIHHITFINKSVELCYKP